MTLTAPNAAPAAPVVPSPAPPAKVPVLLGLRGVQIQTIDEAWRLATLLIQSNLAPKGLDTREKVTIALLQAHELRLPLLLAIQNMAVIGNRLTIYGDLPLALVRSSGKLEEFREWYEDQDGRELKKQNEIDAAYKAANLVACCYAKRAGEPDPLPSFFSIADAARLGLKDKSGPWTTDPKRMTRFRARSRALRDGFADVLNGMNIMEDLDPEDTTEVRATALPAGPSDPVGDLARALGEPAAPALEATAATNGDAAHGAAPVEAPVSDPKPAKERRTRGASLLDVAEAGAGDPEKA